MMPRSPSPPLLLLATLSAAASCAPSGGTPPRDAGASDAAQAEALPCTVADVFRARCQSCHGAPPAYGAPMSLVTYADTQAPARTDPTRPVWQLVAQRIHDAARPMPPTGALTAAELATLDDWTAHGAPANATGICGPADAGLDDAGLGDGGPVGPDALPCPPEQRKTFLAHAAGGDARFHVPTDAGNLYECFTWRSPFDAPTEATAFAPVIDDSRVLHHWILYQTATAQAEGGVGPCHMPADAVFVQGWAPGVGNRVLPPDVGEDLPGTDHWFILQVHYWNVAGYADADDASGVSMCTTTDLRLHHAAVSTLGTPLIAIPPHATDYTTTGSCTPTATEPIHVLSAQPHMHLLGTQFETVVLRGGDPARAETLVSVPHWDFQTQESFPSELVLEPGDVLRTTCHYANPGAETVYFGENTEDEMCFDFVLAWPAGALVSSAGARRNRCIDLP